MTAVPQSATNWCWAACAEVVILHAKSHAVAQCQFADWLLPHARCCAATPPSSTCDKPCAASKIAPLYRHWGLSGATGNSVSVLFHGVQSEINAGRPIQVSFQYGSGCGHAVVVIGWQTASSGDTVDVLDSAHLGRGSVLYNDLYTAFGMGGIWDWSWWNLA